MRPLLRNLRVDELIVHDIPKKLAKRILRGSDELVNEEPVYSEVASPIDANIHNFFHDKISESIGSNDAVDIMFNTEEDNPIKPLVIEYLTSDSNRRIEITKIIAQYLFDIQNAINSSGLLLFARGLVRDKVTLAILKVEREEGIRVRLKEVESGLITFDIEHIRDLMLTRKTKLFKIVLFYEDDDNLIKGILCDKQRSNSEKTVADFFISDFLKCVLIEEPQILTKKFFDETQKFINEKIGSPELKGELINHLISELTDNNTIISPTGFARRVLTPNKCDEYIEYLRNNGVTTGNFTKENNLIENRLKKIQYNFTSGIFVLGTKEAFTSKSRVIEMENGEMKMEITDSLERVNTK